MTERKTTTLLDIPLDCASLEDLTRRSLAAIDARRAPSIFSCANPHSLVVARQDEEFRQALRNAHMVVADGSGVTFMASMAGIEVGPRITGSDYFRAVMEALQRRGSGRVFFFGSSTQVLDLIARRLARDYPALELAGVLSPPFGDWSAQQNAAMVAQINAAQPDVLWVGMTAPKQEKWVEQNRAALEVPLIGSIGAVFDFYAGTKPRAPVWMCRLGIEWLHRLLREPRRMWKRNFDSTPRFVLLVMRHHILS